MAKFYSGISKGKPQYDVKVIGKTDRTGTEVTFVPDDSYLLQLEYNADTLAARLRELSFLNKGIRLTLTDEDELQMKMQKTLTAGNSIVNEGLKEFVKYLDSTRESLIDEPIYVDKSNK